MSYHEELMPTVPWEDVVSAAKAEKWKTVDEHLATFGNDDTAHEWAKSHLRSDVEDEADLAASLYGESKRPLDKDTQGDLRRLMARDTFAGFRAGCALFIHGDNSSEVKARVRWGLDSGDPDAVAAAQKLLSQGDSRV